MSLLALEKSRALLERGLGECPQPAKNTSFCTGGKQQRLGRGRNTLQIVRKKTIQTLKHFTFHCSQSVCSSASAQRVWVSH